MIIKVIRYLFKQSSINQMFDKIQMFLLMKTSISKNRISRLNYSSPCCFIKLKRQEKKKMYYVSSLLLILRCIYNYINWQLLLFVCILQSVLNFSFACVLNFFMNKNTVKTIQTNRIQTLFIALVSAIRSYKSSIILLLITAWL